MESTYAAVLKKLTESSIEHDYNPYRRFEWPERIAEDELMMPLDLMSVYDTPALDDLDGRTLRALSKWESMNFYSMTLHGERELIMVISRHIHTSGFEAPSDFFHRFIGEENYHMWFFSEFCRRYGRIYPDTTVTLSTEDIRPELDVFLSFLRILIFEEVGDYFNLRMCGDPGLPRIVQTLNRVHHEDESRHIAAGRQLAKHLYGLLGDSLSPEETQTLEDNLRQYIAFLLQSLYNPKIYADAGIRDSYGFRRELLRDPCRRKHHEFFLRRPLEFLRSSGIIKGGELLF